MRNRKIRVEIKLDKIKDVLEKLNKISNSIILDLDIEENKNVYKYLSTSDDIISWDFIENKNDNVESSKVDWKDDLTANTNTNTNTIAITNYNELATYVEALWRVSRKSPGIVWGTSFFNKTIAEEYSAVACSSLTLEHGLLVMILQTYYKDADITDALEDTNNKLKNNWSIIGEHLSLASISNFLYK